MSEPSSSPTPDSGADSNYLVVALIVGIPCGVIILVLAVLIAVMLYFTFRSSNHTEQEETYMRRRFQGLSLEQQRKMAKKNRRKKKGIGRRESSISGTFNARVSRTPSNASVSALKNPFGLQEWQIRMYGSSTENASPGTEDTELSWDSEQQGGMHRERRQAPLGAINPLLLQMQDDEDDTPLHSRARRPHPLPVRSHTTSSTNTQSGQGSKQSGKGSRQSGQGSRQSGQGSIQSGHGSRQSGQGSIQSGQGSIQSGHGSRKIELGELDTSSDDSMNPYDN